MRIAPLVGISLAFCLIGCGGSSTTPTTTPGSVTIATGTQMLRVTNTGASCTINGASIFPMVYTRVTVSQVGTEWKGVAATPAAGDVEIRFHQSGASRIAGSMPIEGTIRGLAIHMPELLAGVPSSNSRMDFGSDGRTTITGYAFSPSPITPTGGLDGIGMGTVTLSDNTGRSCPSTTFSWAIAPSA
jgi:hypothetical protein